MRREPVPALLSRARRQRPLAVAERVAPVTSAIYYNPTCILCGAPTSDPFWDELCSDCERAQEEEADVDDWDYVAEDEW